MKTLYILLLVGTGCTFVIYMLLAVIGITALALAIEHIEHIEND